MPPCPGLLLGISLILTMSIAVKPKKRGRPATGKDPLVGIRMSPELTEALDAFAAVQEPALSRSEAVRALVMQGLMREKLLPPLHEQIKALYETYKERQGKKAAEDPESAS